MSVTRLTARDYLQQPWKNGGGITTQLDAHTEDGTLVWRLSVADVSRAGPFSHFPGIDRTIMLLEGSGMVLRFQADLQVKLDRPFVPFPFDGGTSVDCELLDGPVRDLNVMVDRDRARASVETLWLRDPARRKVEADWTLVYALSGTCEAHVASTQHQLESHELLRIDGPVAAGLSLFGHGADPAAAIVEVRRQRT